MKTLIKVVKRGEVSKPVVAPVKPKITTEMIVSSWIIESREQRRATDVSQLQSFVSWTKLGGPARG